MKKETPIAQPEIESEKIVSCAKKTVYFSFCHPDVSPGGAQAIAKRLHDEHKRKHGPGSSLFIGAMIGGGPKRPAGTTILQVKEDEFIYVCERFDYLYFTNHDSDGQISLIKLIESFGPTHLHFHHFMGFGVDFVTALQSMPDVKTVFTVHEHMLVCHNDGHLVQKNNSGICEEPHPARCATCMPEYRYDYFQHRLEHLSALVAKFDVVTAVSDYTANIISRSIPTKHPIRCIPNGPFESSNMVDTISTEKLNVAYIGQVHRTKGVHLLLAAMEGLVEKHQDAAPNLSITIWGSVVLPDYQEQISTQIERLKVLGVDAKLGGVYSSANLKNILHDANIVVVPSLWPESYCITADEAVLLGKILICASFPAAMERFDSTDSVRFVPPGSATAIQNELENLMQKRTIQVRPPFKFVFRDMSEIFELYEEAIQ